MTPKTVTASAPGKIVLLGEYAVLENAPALVAAVDRFATVEVRESDSATCSVTATNLDAAEIAFDLGAERLAWHGQNGPLKLMRTLLDELATRGVLDASTAPFRLSVDSADFYRGNQKIGLGSSAATTAAVALAIEDWTGQKVPRWPDLFELLFDVHRRRQDGTGSGLDIAASLLGGVFSFERSGGGQAAPQVQSLRWPDGLSWCVVWTGTPASTGSYLTRLREFAQQNRAAYDAAMARLGSVARLGIAAFEEGGVDNFLDAVHDYMYALTDFGARTGLDIVNHDHRGLAGLAELTGVVYKPSGAGGGDIGVAFSGKREPLTVFAEQVRRGGQAVLSLGLAGAAVRNVGYP